jgi:hypothetical protein
MKHNVWPFFVRRILKSKYPKIVETPKALYPLKIVKTNITKKQTFTNHGKPWLIITNITNQILYLDNHGQLGSNIVG